MAHHTIKSAYQRLDERLNRCPQGATSSELLFQILKILINEKEAELISVLPIKPFTSQKAARIWKMDSVEAQKILDELSDRAILIDLWEKDQQIYVLPPPMAGFFEFSMMRIRNDIDQKLLAELYYQYMNIEEDFIKELFTVGETQLGRVFVNESVLSQENALVVLDYERASKVITNASHIGISMCYCRHKMKHVGKSCNRPMDICMTFNNSARSLIKHGFTRQADVSECMTLLQTAYEHNLVQFGDNVREKVNFICNCCGCCCEALIAARKFGLMNPVQTTNFIPKIISEKCNGCGKCVAVCPVEAMSLISANDPHHLKKKKAKLYVEICLGCGICSRVCSTNAISLQSRPERVITPLNSSHRSVLMAIERGKLQNLIFDNQIYYHHRALAALLGVILRLPPVKQALATKQMKSRYLETVIKWWGSRQA
ncbi:MAG: 4Fe-4S dicluster domain-containing protein [Desulfobacterales bacterium]|nr:4Fe-4S dicluster domain-containing protein [Desulfobacterales bacterium]